MEVQTSVESTPSTTAVESVESQNIPDIPPPAESIADHAATFSPQAQEAAEELPRDERQAVEKVGKFAKHRSPSQYASPDDVQEINRLTKELRTKESELAKLDPEALAGSPRLRVLRRQIEAIDGKLTKLSPAAAEAPKTTAPAYTPPPSADLGKEPTLEDFADQPDPYLAYVRALARYDRTKELYESQQQQSRQEHEQREVGVYTSHNERMDAFRQSRPDFDAVAGPIMTADLPMLLLRAIAVDDRGPEYVYHLAQRRDVLDQLFLETLHKPIDEHSVAAVQRRLKQLFAPGQAASTGSAARTPYQPPKPPNPVRTGPLKTADDPPGEGSSIADHKRYYGPKR